MANLSDLTRKEQVLVYLRERTDQWVDGTELATAEVGGSEGLKRLRELRVDLREQGKYEIDMRAHPDPARDIFQYRLTERSTPRSGYSKPAPAAPMQVADVPHDVGPPERRNAPGRWDTHLVYDPVTDTYMAVYDGPPVVDEDEPPPLPGQADMGVPEAEGFKYTERPRRVVLGESIPCPMCKNIHRAIKEKDPVTGKATKHSKITGYDEFTRDPHRPSQLCPRCNGFGLIPNKT